jgi:hypothetical protein
MGCRAVYKVFCNCDELYFIYRNRKIRFNDKIFKKIIGFNKKEIYYVKYNKWLLEDDMEKMNKKITLKSQF